MIFPPKNHQKIDKNHDRLKIHKKYAFFSLFAARVRKSCQNGSKKGLLFGGEMNPKSNKITSLAPDAPQRCHNEPQTAIFDSKTWLFAFLAGLRHGEAPEKDAAPGKQKSKRATLILTPKP